MLLPTSTLEQKLLSMYWQNVELSLDSATLKNEEYKHNQDQQSLVRS